MTMKPKTITVKLPYWINPNVLPHYTGKIVVNKVTTIHGIKYYYCKPAWSTIHGWFIDETP